MHNKIKNYKNKGFTLIELMVAISIFMMIMIMAMGAVIVASDASKKADKLRIDMDNVNFAMESMTRSIRMGTNYSGGGNYFSFTSSDDKKISYVLDVDGKLKRQIDNGDFVDMVSGDIKVDTLNFYVKNDGQPSVYITIKGVVDIKSQKYSFALQTLASQRNLE